MNDLLPNVFIALACLTSVASLICVLRMMLVVNKLRDNHQDIKYLLKKVLEFQRRASSTGVGQAMPVNRKEDPEMN